MTPYPRAFLFAASLEVALAVGCAQKAQPAPEAPESPSEAPAAEESADEGTTAPTSLEREDGAAPATLEAADAEFQRVEAELDALFTPAGPGDSSEAQKNKASDDFALRCESACKAFLSLERSAAAICRLAGDSDPRCTRARASVEKNRQRISACACS